MELLARNFECYPTENVAHQCLSPLISRLDAVRFPFRVGTKNSNQFTYDFDEPLEQRFNQLGCAASTLRLCDGLGQKPDFVFYHGNTRVAVEVEKANWEKILYDFLKFHIYFASGADFALLFLPRNYPHNTGVKDSFAAGRTRYDYCVRYGFGSPEIFQRILIVGFDKCTSDGTPLCSDIRRNFIEQSRQGQHS